MRDIEKLYVKMVIRLTALIAFLLILAPCDGCRKPETKIKPQMVDVTKPECQVDVTRHPTNAVVRIKGSLPNDVLGVVSSVLYPKEARYVFKVDSNFDFETRYPIPAAEEMIPMTFLNYRERHLVCRLKFAHSDGSPLTRLELDGEIRTHQTKSEDKF